VSAARGDALSWVVMRTRRGGSILLLSALAALGCSSPDHPVESGPTPYKNGYCGDKTPALLAAAGDPAEPATPLTEQLIDGSACNAVERSYDVTSSTHTAAPCDPVEYSSNPPSSGHHYGIWPRYGAYEYAIPRGFWVHPMEHGGVVFTYSCTDCRDEVQAATQLIEDTAPAPACCTASGCPDSATNQLILTPDPGIPTRWAAAAWTFTLTADCFEPDVFANFIEAHRDSGAAPELVCSNTSTDVTQPGPE